MLAISARIFCSKADSNDLGNVGERWSRTIEGGLGAVVSGLHVLELMLFAKLNAQLDLLLDSGRSEAD